MELEKGVNESGLETVLLSFTEQITPMGFAKNQWKTRKKPRLSGNYLPKLSSEVLIYKRWIPTFYFWIDDNYPKAINSEQALVFTSERVQSASIPIIRHLNLKFASLESAQKVKYILSQLGFSIQFYHSSVCWCMAFCLENFLIRSKTDPLARIFANLSGFFESNTNHELNALDSRSKRTAGWCSWI